MRATARIGVGLLILTVGCNGPAEQAVGTLAPPTKGTDADGATFALADFKGKAVMLDFWGNW